MARDLTEYAVRTWKECMVLAKSIGCTAQRLIFTNKTVWLIDPPSGIYRPGMGSTQTIATREIPEKEGPHDDTEFLWDALQRFRVDLHFHRYGVGSILTQAILTALDGTGKEILEDWIVTKKVSRGMILADYLEELGHPDTATHLQKCLEWYYQQERRLIPARIYLNTDTSSTGSSSISDDY